MIKGVGMDHLTLVVSVLAVTLCRPPHNKRGSSDTSSSCEVLYLSVTQLPSAWDQLSLGEQHSPGGAGSEASLICCHLSHSLGGCSCFQVEWKPYGARQGNGAPGALGFLHGFPSRLCWCLAPP